MNTIPATKRWQDDQYQCVIIDAKIQGKNYKTIIDTGSGISIIGGELFSQLQEEGKLERVESKAIAANKQIMYIQGIIPLKITIKEQAIEHSFRVIEEMEKAILLGNDFFKKNWKIWRKILT